MGYLTDLAMKQALIVVAPGAIAGQWVVERIFPDGTREGLLPDSPLDKAKDYADVKAAELGGIAVTIAGSVADALGDLGEDILEGLKSVGSSLGNATLQVVEYAGPALVDGIENTYDYIRGKLRGREPDIIAAITVGALAVLAGVYLFNAAKRGTMTYTE